LQNKILAVIFEVPKDLFTTLRLVKTTTPFQSEPHNMTGLGGKDMKCDPPTGINVAIVGGGIAGLSFAIESIRKGHTVTVYERKPEVGNFGKYQSTRHYFDWILT